MKNIIILLIALISVSSCKKDKNNPMPNQTNNGGNGNNDGGNNNGGNNGGVVADLELTSSTGIKNPCGLAISKSGVVAVTEYNGFEGYGKKGTTRVWASYNDMMQNKAPMATWQNTGAEAAAFDEKDNLYIAETEQVAGIAVYKRTAAGYTLAKTIQGGFNNPRGLAVHEGKLYLADDGNKRIVRFNDPMNSNAYTAVLTQIQGPKAVAVDGNDLYIAEYGADRVSKYTIGNWDAPVTAISVDKPVDVAVKGGLMVVGQPEAGTIQQFSTADLTIATKQTATGGNVFGLAFAPGNDKTLFVAAFDQKKINAYQVK